MDLKDTEKIHTALKTSADLLRQSAALHRANAEAGPVLVGKEAEAETPQAPTLDEARVRDVYEDLAALNLTKTAEIDDAVAAAVEDPNVMLGVLHKAAGHLAAAQTEQVEKMAPGQLVQKRASTKVDPISEATQKVRQKLERMEAAG